MKIDKLINERIKDFEGNKEVRIVERNGKKYKVTIDWDWLDFIDECDEVMEK